MDQLFEMGCFSLLVPQSPESAKFLLANFLWLFTLGTTISKAVIATFYLTKVKKDMLFPLLVNRNSAALGTSGKESL